MDANKLFEVERADGGWRWSIDGKIDEATDPQVRYAQGWTARRAEAIRAAKDAAKGNGWAVDWHYAAAA